MMQRQRVSSFEMTCHQPTMQSLVGQCGYVQAYPMNAVAVRWAGYPSLPGVWFSADFALHARLHVV